MDSNFDFFNESSADLQAIVEEQADLYDLAEIGEMCRENYKQLIISLAAFIHRCKIEGRSITDASVEQLDIVHQNLVKNTEEGTDLPLEDLIIVAQGGIIGFAHEHGDGLEAVTQALQEISKRSN